MYSRLSIYLSAADLPDQFPANLRFYKDSNFSNKLVSKVSGTALVGNQTLAVDGFSAIDQVIVHVKGTGAVSIAHSPQALRVAGESVALLNVVSVGTAITYTRLTTDSAVDFYIIGDAA
jgi:hypothetical protein